MAELRIPKWTLGDRLRKAREDARPPLSIQDMADKLGVHRNTITAWEADRPIKPGMVRAWSTICEVDLDWLENGTIDLHEQRKRTSSCQQLSRPYEPRLFDPDGLAEVVDIRDHVVAQMGDNDSLYLLSTGSGQRCCGCANLKCEDIDLGRRTVFVTEKGGHSRRLPLTNDVMRALDLYLFEHPERSGPLLRSYTSPWAGISAQHISVIVGRWMSGSGVKRRANDGRSAHALRRTALTEVAEATGDAFVVQELAGWVSPAYASHYVKAASTERVRAALEAR